jgi:hypothetical protein
MQNGRSIERPYCFRPGLEPGRRTIFAALRDQITTTLAPTLTRP